MVWCHGRDQQCNSSAELQRIALYKQLLAFVMPDHPSFPYAKPFLQHIEFLKALHISILSLLWQQLNNVYKWKHLLLLLACYSNLLPQYFQPKWIYRASLTVSEIENLWLMTEPKHGSLYGRASASRFSVRWTPSDDVGMEEIPHPVQPSASCWDSYHDCQFFLKVLQCGQFQTNVRWKQFWV